MLRFSKEFSLVWFFLIFIGVVAWAYLPSHKKGFEDAGQRVLDEDPLHELSAKQTSERSVSSEENDDKNSKKS
ncbi:MAG: cbb3-type cytochrome c oxidase subunit 3 [Magnetococcales bacterium]|nr:cbb3-type cytochrome c oxidase subunit 3 [Magnetococcales bacterium]